MLTRFDQFETGHTIRLSIFTVLASKKHIFRFLSIHFYVDFVIKYQTILYIFRSIFSTVYKTFLPKKKK